MYTLLRKLIKSFEREVRKMLSWETTINMARDMYVAVYGLEKWESFTNQERRQIVMTLVNDMLKALDD